MKSKFGVLAITTGRSKIAARVRKGERIPVTIRGLIGSKISRDDGTSIEFVIEVADVVEAA